MLEKVRIKDLLRPEIVKKLSLANDVSEKIMVKLLKNCQVDSYVELLSLMSRAALQYKFTYIHPLHYGLISDLTWYEQNKIKKKKKSASDSHTVGDAWIRHCNKENMKLVEMLESDQIDDENIALEINILKKLINYDERGFVSIEV